jgi:predicted nucleic-acid-binding protein
MLAVDTNIIVRYLTADDPDQFARAVTVLEESETFIGHTVLLEAEWVLRSLYHYRSAEILSALRGLAGLPGVTIEDSGVASLALQWVEGGLDFADALHLARAQPCDAFITFDQDLGTKAAELSTVPVQLP